jgi:hypothetical protein
VSDAIQELVKICSDRRESETKFLQALSELSRENSRLEAENIRLESELCALQSQSAGDSFVGSIDAAEAPLLP